MGTSRGSARKYEQFLYNTNNMLLTPLVWKEELAVIHLLLTVHDLQVRNAPKEVRELARRRRDEAAKEREKQETQGEEARAVQVEPQTKMQKRREKRLRKKELQKVQATKQNTSGFQKQKDMINKMMEKVKKGEDVSSKCEMLYCEIIFGVLF
jgi:hypothetical protein